MTDVVYKIYVDWDNNGSVLASATNLSANPGFETDTSFWTAGASFWANAGGTLSRITSDFHSGAACGQVVTTAATAHQGATTNFTGFAAGTVYNVSGWLKVVSGRPVTLNARDTTNGVSASSASVSVNAWTFVSFTITTGAAGNVSLTLSVVTDAIAGIGTFEFDDIFIAPAVTANEDVSNYVLGLRTPLGWAYGRDTYRSMSALTPGTANLELNNNLTGHARLFSPDNAASPLYGLIGPGKPVLVTGSLSNVTHCLFFGFIDDFNIDPTREKKSVSVSVFDPAGRLSGVKVTVPLYSGIRTGDAINLVLDAVGWPSAQRDIDPGATTIQWFWLHDADALSTLNDLVASEGGPALIRSSGGGKIIFRGRHHRLLNTASTTVQASFSDDTPDPSYCAPASYNIGFKDLVNSVLFSVDEREPASALSTVWSTQDSIIVSPGSPKVFSAQGGDPFYGAVTPVAGTDFAVTSGSVTVALSATSGQSVDITVSATGATPAYLDGMALRAIAVPVSRTYSVLAENASSIAKYGKKSWTEGTPPWVGQNDALALAQVLLAQRSERLPVMSITVNNGTDVRKAQILSRAISDRVHIIEPQTGTNHDHFVERVQHDINDVGKDHRLTLGCERVRTVTGTQFTFDVAGAGFDQGSFGLPGFDDPATVLILGSAVTAHCIGAGKLAT